MRSRALTTGRWPGAAIGAALLVVLAGFGMAARAAEPPSLGPPLDCTPGETCWIVNYVDHDPTEGIRDYMCGNETYNGTTSTAEIHRGTDFAIRDAAAMRAGVAVLAAAAGRVADTRDGMVDQAFVWPVGKEASKGDRCGNRVVIDHGGGWTTEYCHMRQGSIVVRRGQEVRKGEPLGLVGESGPTAFPHVHLQVMKGKEPVDPFVGVGRGPKCSPGIAPLWDAATMAELPYALGQIFNIGFAGEEPSIGKIRDGAYRANALDRRVPALALWAEAFNLQAGDRLRLTIRAPDGRTLVDHLAPIEKKSTRSWKYASQSLRENAWPAGTYLGEARIERADGTASARNATVTLR